MSSNFSLINGSSQLTCSPFAGATPTTIGQNVGNVILGCLAFVPNFLVAITILSTRDLRRRNELLIFGWFAAGEVFGSLALTIGAFRYFTLQKGDPCVTPLQCMSLVQFTPNIGSQFFLMMLCIISLDRFIFVVKYELHQSFTHLYPMLMIGVPMGIQVVSYAVAWVAGINWPANPLVGPTCGASTFLPPWYILWNNILTSSATTASVVIYILVMLVFKFCSKAAYSEFEDIKNAQMERQRKITHLFAVLATITAVFFVIPQLTYLFMSWLCGLHGCLQAPWYAQNFVPAIQTLKLLHSCIYSGVYILRPHEVRDRLVAGIFKILGIKRQKKLFKQQSMTATSTKQGGHGTGSTSGFKVKSLGSGSVSLGPASGVVVQQLDDVD